MNAVDAIKTGLRKSFIFKGRASRTEFVGVGATYMAVLFGLAQVASLSSSIQMPPHNIASWGMVGLVFLCLLALTAIASRRWYDAGFTKKLPITMLIMIVTIAALVALDDADIIHINDGVGTVLGAIYFSSLILILICVFVAVFMPSVSQTSNTYGPNPNEVPQ